MYIFISHSSKDADKAQDLCNILEVNGSNCFVSFRDIRPGFEYATEIIDAIDRSNVMILMLSNSAISSPHILREIERAVSKSIPIIVYKLEDVVLSKSFEYFLMSHQWLDAECCRYEILLKSIKDMENDTSTTYTNANDIKLGDTVAFGSYNNADIHWNVLKISEDKTEALLVSKNILTFKCFDGAKSGKYSHTTTDDMNLLAQNMGSNNWQTSTIRAWLNSDKDYVYYQGQAPTAQSMSDGCNSYNLEAGFLYGFNSLELSAIKETTIETKGNVLANSDKITTKDRVFLLSLNDLELFDNARVSLLSVPTKEAVDNNESSYYTEYCQGVFKVDSAQWWLRDPLDNSSTECYQVSHGAKIDEKICTSIACADGYGIRPALIVDLTSRSVKVIK